MLCYVAASRSSACCHCRWPPAQVSMVLQMCSGKEDKQNRIEHRQEDGVHGALTSIEVKASFFP